MNPDKSVRVWPKLYTYPKHRSEISFVAPHFLDKGLSFSPIMHRCLLRVLCPVKRPVITLDCILLQGSNLVLAARLRTEINSLACLW